MKKKYIFLHHLRRQSTCSSSLQYAAELVWSRRPADDGNQRGNTTGNPAHGNVVEFLLTRLFSECSPHSRLYNNSNNPREQSIYFSQFLRSAYSWGGLMEEWWMLSCSRREDVSERVIWWRLIDRRGWRAAHCPQTDRLFLSRSRSLAFFIPPPLLIVLALNLPAAAQQCGSCL